MKSRRRTVAHVIRDLLLFIKDIKGKPALLRAADSSFILDRVRDLCVHEGRRELALATLPEDVIQRCLRYLGPEELLVVGQVSKSFLRMANYSEHWKFLLPLEFPVPLKNNFDYRNCYLRMRNKPNSLEALSPSIEIEGLKAAFIGEMPALSGVLIRANHPIKLTSFFFFEVRIEDAQNANISVGLASEDYPQMHPGYYHLSFAYHSDRGSLFCNSEERDWGPAFDDGDCVGCGFEPTTGKLFFTKNEELLGSPFDLDMRMREKLYPAIGLQTPGQIVRVELGTDPESFVFPIFDISEMRPLILQPFDVSVSSDQLSVTSEEVVIPLRDDEQFSDQFSVSSGATSSYDGTSHWDSNLAISDYSQESGFAVEHSAEPDAARLRLRDRGQAWESSHRRRRWERREDDE